jgi:hypothetical protein
MRLAEPAGGLPAAGSEGHGADDVSHLGSEPILLDQPVTPRPDAEPTTTPDVPTASGRYILRRQTAWLSYEFVDDTGSVLGTMSPSRWRLFGPTITTSAGSYRSPWRSETTRFSVHREGAHICLGKTVDVVRPDGRSLRAKLVKGKWDSFRKAKDWPLPVTMA